MSFFASLSNILLVGRMLGQETPESRDLKSPCYKLFLCLHSAGFCTCIQQLFTYDHLIPHRSKYFILKAQLIIMSYLSCFLALYFVSMVLTISCRPEETFYCQYNFITVICLFISIYLHSQNVTFMQHLILCTNQSQFNKTKNMSSHVYLDTNNCNKTGRK